MATEERGPIAFVTLPRNATAPVGGAEVPRPGSPASPASIGRAATAPGRTGVQLQLPKGVPGSCPVSQPLLLPKGSPSSVPAPAAELQPQSKSQTVAAELRRPNSCPSLPAAFNLRQYSQRRRHVTPKRCSSGPNVVLGEDDLVGGNGKWRQKRAQEEWQRRQAEDRQRKREQEILDQERKRRREELEARRRRYHEETERRFHEDVERRRREQEDIEERRRQQEEAKRTKERAEEEEWRARQPKTCDTCVGVGKCTVCLGKGYLYALFLSPTVTKETEVDYGRLLQGCESCGGCAHNIVGELKTGTGRCVTCGGAGKVKPKVKQSVLKRSGSRVGFADRSTDRQSLSMSAGINFAALVGQA